VLVGQIDDKYSRLEINDALARHYDQSVTMIRVVYPVQPRETSN
jgi:hypothetical protein